MKKLNLLLPLSALLVGTATASPFIAVGSSAELFVTAKVGLEINDNITLGNGAGNPPSNPVQDDVIWKFSPGLSYEFGQNSLLSGKLAYVENFSIFGDNSDLDSELSDVTFNARHDDGGNVTKLKASFRQLNQNTVDLRSPTLSRRDVTNIGGEHEMEFSVKSSLLFGFDYTDTNYERATFSDRIRTDIPVRYYWEMSPKVDLSFSLTYRETEVERIDGGSTDLLYAIGARGDFTPKLKGYFRVGLADRNLDSGSDRTTFSLASNFDYVYSEKTSLNFGVNNGFGTSGTAESQENLDFFVGVRSKLSPEFTLSSRVSYRQIDYFTRADDAYIEGRVSGSYIFNEYVTVTGSYVYKNNDGGTPTADFDNNVISLSAQLRY